MPRGGPDGAAHRAGAEAHARTARPRDLELESADGAPLPRYRPGQFTMIYVFGVGEIPVSISGDAADPSRLVQTIRSVGAVSEAVTALTARRPAGIARPVRHVPGRPRNWPDRTWWWWPAGSAWHRCARPSITCSPTARSSARWCCCTARAARTEILYRRQLETWRKRLDVQIEVTVDHAGGEWRGNVGVVTRLIPKLAIDVHHATALVCGPEVMMRFAARGTARHRHARDAIWVSIERNMKCAVGLCGHCQFAGMFACKDGAVVRYDRVRRLMGLKEI